MLTALPAVAAYAGDVKNCWILQVYCGMLCAYQEKGEKYEMSEKTGHAQRFYWRPASV